MTPELIPRAPGKDGISTHSRIEKYITSDNEDEVICDFEKDPKRVFLNQSIYENYIPPSLLKDLSNENFYFVVDNTPYPPNGAYMKKDISVKLSTEINYVLDEKYYNFIIIFSIVSGVLLLMLILLIWKYVKQKKSYEEVSHYLRMYCKQPLEGDREIDNIADDASVKPRSMSKVSTGIVSNGSALKINRTLHDPMNDDKDISFLVK